MREQPVRQRASRGLCQPGHECSAAGARCASRATRFLAAGLAALALGFGFVSSTHAASCTVSSSGLGFGLYNPFGLTALDSTGSITLNCLGAAGEAVAFQVSASTGFSQTYGSRLMRGPHEPFLLSYNLYVDPARSTIWGDGSGTSAVITGLIAFPLPSAITRLVDFYGRIPARQNVRPQSYQDTIVITVNF